MFVAVFGLHLAFDLALLEEIYEALLGLHIAVDFAVEFDFGLHLSSAWILGLACWMWT